MGNLRKASRRGKGTRRKATGRKVRNIGGKATGRKGTRHKGTRHKVRKIGRKGTGRKGTRRKGTGRKSRKYRQRGGVTKALPPPHFKRMGHIFLMDFGIAEKQAKESGVWREP